MIKVILLIHLMSAIMGIELIVAESILRKVVSTISLFLGVAVYLLIIGNEFFSFLMVIVYVGAISVLFLFVIMFYARYLLVRTFAEVWYGVIVIMGVTCLWLSNNTLVEYGEVGHNGRAFSEGVLREAVVDGSGWLTLLDGLGVQLWCVYSCSVMVAAILIFVGVIGSIGCLKTIFLVRMYSGRRTSSSKGALTNKVIAFKARPWEETKVRLVNIFDTCLQPIFLAVRGFEITRVLPAEGGELFEFPWITDKTRFFYDGLVRQRVVRPGVSGRVLVDCTWENGLCLGAYVLRRFLVDQLNMLGSRGRSQAMLGLSGMWDLRSMLAFKRWGGWLGGGLVTSGKRSGRSLNVCLSSGRLSRFFAISEWVKKLNSKQRLVTCLLIGIDLRFELPLLNIICRNFLRKGTISVILGFGVRGLRVTKVNVRQIGIASDSLVKIMEGRHLGSNFLRKKLINSELLVLGGLGIEGWLANVQRCGDSLFDRWLAKKNGVAKILYSSVGSFGEWFVGLGEGVGRFDLGVRQELRVLQVGVREKEGDSVGRMKIAKKDLIKYDILFGSFAEHIEQAGCLGEGGYKSLILPTSTVLEHEMLVLGLEGQIESIPAVSFAHQNGVIVHEENFKPVKMKLIRTVRRVVAMFGLLMWTWWIRVELSIFDTGSFEKVVGEFRKNNIAGTKTLRDNWGQAVEESLRFGTLQKVCCEKFFGLQAYSVDFFKMDVISRNSVLAYRLGGADFIMKSNYAR